MHHFPATVFAIDPCVRLGKMGVPASFRHVAQHGGHKAVDHAPHAVGRFAEFRSRGTPCLARHVVVVLLLVPCCNVSQVLVASRRRAMPGSWCWPCKARAAVTPLLPCPAMPSAVAVMLHALSIHSAQDRRPVAWHASVVRQAALCMLAAPLRLPRSLCSLAYMWAAA